MPKSNRALLVDKKKSRRIHLGYMQIRFWPPLAPPPLVKRDYWTAVRPLKRCPKPSWKAFTLLYQKGGVATFEKTASTARVPSIKYQSIVSVRDKTRQWSFFRFNWSSCSSSSSSMIDKIAEDRLKSGISETQWPLTISFTTCQVSIGGKWHKRNLFTPFSMQPPPRNQKCHFMQL